MYRILECHIQLAVISHIYNTHIHHNLRSKYYQHPTSQKREVKRVSISLKVIELVSTKLHYGVPSKDLEHPWSPRACRSSSRLMTLLFGNRYLCKGAKIKNDSLKIFC